MPYLGLHTPSPTCWASGRWRLKVAEVYAANDNPTVQEILDNLMTIREYAEAPEGQRPAIWVGGRTATRERPWWIFAGGLGAELDELKALMTAGVGTFVCMHMDADIVKSPAGGQPLQCAVHGSHGQRLHWL